MTDQSSQLVQKLWNYCNILRDDGLSYGDYVEQLTFLLFLKMADEQSRAPFNKPSPIPKNVDWQSLMRLDGDELETHYRHVLESLGKQKGMLGVIFRKAQNKIQDPAKLRPLIVDLIDKEQWSSLSADVKGDAYEGLLQKNAEDVKGGAGQYFTPRPLIAAMVDVMRPEPKMTICDPACGTGGFLLAAYNYLSDPQHYRLDREQKIKLASDTLYGVELVDGVARLCCMNMLLHGISADGADEVPVEIRDALGSHGGKYYEMVMTNPPFGKKSSVTIVNEEGRAEKESLTIHRDDFWASTSNKQLNFLQHVFTILKQHGRAAIVVPDNVLFEGGAGETVRRELLKQADVHTLLRLPTGIFYAQGVKANVLFFDRKPARENAWTEKLWIYDLRTNKHFTLKETQLKRADLDDFVACWFGLGVEQASRLFSENPRRDAAATLNRYQRKETERFKCFGYDDLIKRDKVNLDIFWLKDESLEDSANLPPPDVIAAEIMDDPIEGGCLCGAIRYRALGQPYDITHCHCGTCRRASGAPFVTWASVDADKFTFINGKPTSYASSANVVRTFCNKCGTALTYKRADAPGAIDITLGSMDDPEALTPEDHTWTERRLSWIALADGLPTYICERKRE